MGLGPGEIVLILVIAYVVVGPEDMSKLARTLAKGLRELRKLRADLQADVGESISLQPLSAGMQENDPLRPLRAELENSLSFSEKKTGNDASLSGIQKQTAEDLESVMNEIRKTEEQIEACTGRQNGA